MYQTNKLPQLLFLVFACLTALVARAENSQDFGDYVVHFNALTTDMLSPKVATEYNIKRSGNHAMLNVVVLRKVLGAVAQPVTAQITGTARKLTGQQRPLTLREIHEPNAIYYIADFGVDNEDTLTFHLDVKPDGAQETYAVQFRQQFFTH